MQSKKPEDNSFSTEDVTPGRSRVIVWGLISGAVASAALGAWWYNSHQKSFGRLNNFQNSPLELLSPPQGKPLAKAPKVEQAPLPAPLPVPVPTAIEKKEKPQQHATPAEKQAKPVHKQAALKRKSPKLLGEPITEPKNSGAKQNFIGKEKFQPIFYQYNSMQPGPVISAREGVEIETSMDADFHHIYSRHVADSKGEVVLPNPPPGSFYWRLEGQKKGNKIEIGEPPSTDTALVDKPHSLAEGELLKWKANENASYFKMEFSSSQNFAGPSKIFSTKFHSLNTKLVGKGLWYVRLSALNNKSGSFESLPVFSLEITEPILQPENTDAVEEKSSQENPSPQAEVSKESATHEEAPAQSATHEEAPAESATQEESPAQSATHDGASEQSSS